MKNKLSEEEKCNILVDKLMFYVKDSYKKYLKEYGGGEAGWPDQKGYYEYTLDSPLDEFIVEFYTRRHFVTTGEGVAYCGNTYIENEIIEILVTLDPEKEPHNYEPLIGHLKDVVTHEMEHLNQKDKELDDKVIDFNLRHKAKIKGNEWTYFILPEEIPPMVKGLYAKSKHNKSSFQKEAKIYLDYQLENGMIQTQDQYNEIINTWLDYYNRDIKRLNETKIIDLINEDY